MRWIWLGVAVVGLLLSFLTHNVGVLALGLLLAFVGSFATFLSFVSERVGDRSRPDTAMLSPDALAALHGRQDQPHRSDSSQSPKMGKNSRSGHANDVSRTADS